MRFPKERNSNEYFQIIDFTPRPTSELSRSKPYSPDEYVRDWKDQLKRIAVSNEFTFDISSHEFDILYFTMKQFTDFYLVT